MYEPILPAVWESSQVILQKSAPDTPSIAGSWCQAFVTGEAGNGNPGGETATDARRGEVLGAGNMSCLQPSLHVSEGASPSMRGTGGQSSGEDMDSIPEAKSQGAQPQPGQNGLSSIRTKRQDDAAGMFTPQ